MVSLNPAHPVQKVSELLEENGVGWNRERIRNLFSPQIAIKVFQTNQVDCGQGSNLVAFKQGRGVYCEEWLSGDMEDRGNNKS